MKEARNPTGSGGLQVPKLCHLLLAQISGTVSVSMPPIVGTKLRDPAEFRFRKCATYCWHKKATIKSFIWQLVGLIIILFFIQFDLLLIWETLPQFMDVLWHSGRSQALL